MNNPAAPNAGLTMSDLFENPALRAYLSNVRDWHGYVRFLGLPDRRDNPDVLIDRLFVEPLLTARNVSPDEDPSSWIDGAETVFEALKTARPVMLLGDPGTGKSTLLNYLVWLLARPTGDLWAERMGAWLLPVPMVLRELHIRDATDFDGLLHGFLNHAMSEPLRNGSYLHEMLAEGKAFILLDGIDEIGDPTARQHLRTAVFDGFARYPRCRWLLSSRIVGYDEAPFDSESNLPAQRSTRSDSRTESLKRSLRADGWKMPAPEGLHETADTARRFDVGAVVIRYIAPFDDQRIKAFARNWYVQREAAKGRAGDNAMHLVRAVHADDAILRLARIPNLLTMMALIHRIEATLPHGRALLYERIAEAYLESIDRFRGVNSGAYNLQQKRRWLARVGYEMQRRRSHDQLSEKGGDESELLAESGDVISWLSEEMDQGVTSEGMSAAEFMDFVCRRSGLLLPRSEGRYAFAHLSFQEYFAAVALEREVTGSSWARGERTRLRLTHNTLAEWAGQSAWRETFAFLFELLASKEDWHADLLEAVFGKQFSRFASTKEASVVSDLNRAQLLARLVVNPRSGLPRKKEREAIAAAVRPALSRQPGTEHERRLYGVFAELLGDDSDWNANVLEVTGELLEKFHIRSLDLANTRISDLAPLARFTMLQSINLNGTPVSNLAPLTNLATLRTLDLGETPVSDLAPLADLAALRMLDLRQTRVSDLAPLANLAALQTLFLERTRVSDLAPLASLGALRTLFLWQTRVSDLAPLANLAALRTLFLWRAPMSDLAPLANLTALQELYLWETPVSDLAPLANLTALQMLNLWDTRVSDLAPLANLTALQTLDLRETRVSDLAPLANLTALQTLDLRETRVSDLAPLANLTALQTLDLRETPVSDLAPLANLTALQKLDLGETPVSDLAPLANLTALLELDMRGVLASERAVAELRDALPECKTLWTDRRHQNLEVEP